jgi:tetratricopeptide (TPR) repeat protein
MVGKDGSRSDSSSSNSHFDNGPDEGGRGPREGKGVPFVVIGLILCTLIAIGYIVFTPKETPLGKAANLVRTNKAASAVPLLEDLVKQNPADVSVYPWLAQAYLATDRFAEGRTALDTAFRVRSQDVNLAPVVDSYSLYYQNHNHYEEAERLYDSALQVVKPAELANSRARMYLHWSEANLASGAIDSAVTHLSKAWQYADSLDEPLKSQVPHRLAECYRQLAGLAESRDKDENLAIAMLEKSLTVSDEPGTRLALADLYSHRKDTSKAIENYKIVCKQDANNLEARHRLIDLLLAKKDLPGAQEALTELVDKEKSFANYELLASLNLKLQNYPGAVRSLEEAVSLKPENSIALLKQLLTTLNTWGTVLNRENKTQEAMSVKGHAERVAEQLTMLIKEQKKDEVKAEIKSDRLNAGSPISVVSSRNWLAKGSLTPEGEIKIKNVSGEPITDLTLTAVFFDNTRRRNNGSVTLPVASSASMPFAPGAERSLYFSCPNIVKDDHQLAVIIYWKGKLLQEFPVVKHH